MTEHPDAPGRRRGSQFLGRWTYPSTPCAVSVPARMAARSWATKARSWRSISWRAARMSTGIGSSATSLLRFVWLAMPVQVMRVPSDRANAAGAARFATPFIALGATSSAPDGTHHTRTGAPLLGRAPLARAAGYGCGGLPTGKIMGKSYAILYWCVDRGNRPRHQLPRATRRA